MTEIMWSVAQIAARDKVSKAAVSKTVKRLLEERPETPVERGGQGQVLGISLAHYDHFRQRHVNPAKATAPLRGTDGVIADGRMPVDPPPTAPIRSEESFEEARRQSEWLKVSREKLRMQEERGQLVRRDLIDQATVAIAAELQAVIRRLPNRADEVALAVSKEGIHGVRTLLRKIAFEIGNEMADKVQAIALSAPEFDPPIEEEEA